ncbi:hypothetical protein A2U01_0068569, partial [Trifolium medium]|nr:hypothetical protein [Trifolium medium]
FRWMRINTDRNRLPPLPGQTTHGSRTNRGIPFPCTRSAGTIFPRICSQTSAPRRIGWSVSQARRGGFAPRGVGAPFP